MGYITEARERGRRRRSPWNLLLIPAYIVPWSLLTFGVAILASKVYVSVNPGSVLRILPDSLGGVLMAVGALFACLAPSMIIANIFVSLVPAARRALDAEGSDESGTSRRAANRRLLRVSLWLTPASLLLVVVGILVG